MFARHTMIRPPGISLWTLWTARGPRGRNLPKSTPKRHALGEDAERAEAGPARRRSSSPGTPSSSSSASPSASASSRPRASWSVCAPPVRLRHDPVDHAELEAVRGVGLERGRGLLRLARVAPEDRGAALGRDHRVDRVLLHQHPVGERDRDRAARAALADHAGDDRHRQPRHRRLRRARSRRPARAARRRRPDTRPACRPARSPESRAARRAPSRASPSGSPPGSASRTGAPRARGCLAPSAGRRARPCGRRACPRPATIAPSSPSPRSPCSSNQSSSSRST